MRLDLRTAAEQLCRSVRLIARRAAAAEANQPTVYILRPCPSPSRWWVKMPLRRRQLWRKAGV